MNDDNPTFEAPWQARAFALAVVLSTYENGVYTWEEFQNHLVAEVQSTTSDETTPDETELGPTVTGSETVYYERWLRALERVLLEEGLVDPDEMRHRIRAFADGDRDASEFIDGEHDHIRPHPDEHDPGHDHEH